MKGTFKEPTQFPHAVPGRYAARCFYCGDWLFKGPEIAFSGTSTCQGCGYLNLFQSSSQPTRAIPSLPQPLWFLSRILGKSVRKFLLQTRTLLLDLGTKSRQRQAIRNGNERAQ